METKSYAVLFLLLLLTVMVSLGMVPCQGQLEWSTTYRIKVHAGGSATWIIERRALNVSNLFHYSSMEYLQEFSSNISALVNSAWLETGREGMKTENFKITTTVSQTTTTGSYGVIKYQFDWLRFAEIKGTRIFIGDVFIEGIFLFGDGALIIEYPQEYTVADVSPQPDETREFDQALKWYGLQESGEGEPRVILEKRTLSPMHFLQEYAPVIAVIIVLAGIGSASLWLFRFRKRERIDVSSLLKVPLGIEDEEEKVVTLLRSAGGRLYQSTITKQLGFPRSKTSKLLTAMENNGIVRRQKKGREKLVTLIDKVKKIKETRNKGKERY